MEAVITIASYLKGYHIHLICWLNSYYYVSHLTATCTAVSITSMLVAFVVIILLSPFFRLWHRKRTTSLLIPPTKLWLAGSLFQPVKQPFNQHNNSLTWTSKKFGDMGRHSEAWNQAIDTVTHTRKALVTLMFLFSQSPFWPIFLLKKKKNELDGTFVRLHRPVQRYIHLTLTSSCWCLYHLYFFLLLHNLLLRLWV